MRRKLVFGLGLAGVLSGSAFGQLAADRVPSSPSPMNPATPAPGVPGNSGGTPAASPTMPAPPPLPPGVRPIGSTTTGGAYVPPVGGIGTLPTPGGSGIAPTTPPAPSPPMDTTIPSALGPNHPWAVKAEDGAYFICVKSYSRPSRPDESDHGPTARELAEALATDIRDLYRVQAFLFEYVSEERKAEMAALAAARERGRLFASQIEKYKQDAELKGMVFLEEDRIKIHYKTVKYNDQIAVLVGGFKSDKDARTALTEVRKWLPPKNKNLMDGAAIGRIGKDGKQEVADSYLNPYISAHVVPNPMIARAPQAADTGIDPFIVKLNADRPYNLLKATKSWTLAVKSFSAPVEIVGRDGDGAGLMRKTSEHKGAEALQAGWVQAESMAKALREMKGPGGQSLGLEAFVLHTNNASIVTIGQFDGPNDPALLQLQQLLTGMKMNVTEDKAGTRQTSNTPTLFGKMIPIPIPKP